MHKHSHFAVLLFDIEENLAEIFDGLGKPVDMWNTHVLTVLKCSRLIDRCASHTFTTDGGAVSLEADNQEWRISLGNFLKQNDGHICGPIVMLKLMDIYQCVETHIMDQDMTLTDYRSIVGRKSKELISELNNELNVSLPHFVCEIRDNEDAVKSETSKVKGQHTKHNVICGGHAG